MASKPKINKMITKVNFSDSNRSAGQIKYLVKHFVGATGGAEANCRYFGLSTLFQTNFFRLFFRYCTGV